MKLDEKRRVIEVLLCSAGDTVSGRRTTWSVAADIGEHDTRILSASNDGWVDMRRNKLTANATHGDICLEAAYRLIESSPTLRKEWFGR